MTAPDNTPDDPFYPCSYSGGTAFFTGAAMGVLVSSTILCIALSFISNTPLPTIFSGVWVAFIVIIVFCAATAYYLDRLYKKSIQRGDDQPEPEEEDNNNNTL